MRDRVVVHLCVWCNKEKERARWGDCDGDEFQDGLFFSLFALVLVFPCFFK